MVRIVEPHPLPQRPTDPRAEREQRCGKRPIHPPGPSPRPRAINLHRGWSPRL